jgi:hypothetical protein
MTCERSRVRHDHAISNQAIVRDVRLGHEKAIIAYPGHSAATRRAPVNGNEFANPRPAADFRNGLFAGEFQILRRQSDRNKREDMTFVAEPRAAINNAMPVDANTISEYYFIADDRVWTNRAITAQLSA